MVFKNYSRALKLCFECLFFQVIWKVFTRSGSQYFTFIALCWSLALQLRSAASLLASSKIFTMVLFFPFLSPLNSASLLLYPFTILPLFWGFYLFFEIWVQRSLILINTSIIFISFVESFFGNICFTLRWSCFFPPLFQGFARSLARSSRAVPQFWRFCAWWPAVLWHVVLGRSGSSVMWLSFLPQGPDSVQQWNH